MTPATVDNHRAKQQQNRRCRSSKVIDNGDATVEEIRDEKSKVEALTALNQAKDDLRADQKQHKLPELDQRGITEGKTSKHHCL